MSQKQRLLELLSDSLPHRSDEIVAKVYSVSDGVWLARLGARIWDLKQEGYDIKSWPDPDNRKLWWYQKLGLVKNQDFVGNGAIPKNPVAPRELVQSGKSATQGEFCLGLTP